MSKKILGICAALVALAALAIPAAATASPRLAETCEGGKYCTLNPGVKVTATQDEHSVLEAGGIQLTCSENWMTGKVHTNDGTNGITIEFTGASFKGTESETRCNGGSLLGPTRTRIPALEGGGGAWCFKSVGNTDNFEVLPHGCTTTGGAFTFILEGNLSCTYTRSEGLGGHFTTTEEASTAATLKFTNEPGFSKEAGSFFCPSSEKITTMSFYLYTDEPETPVYIEDV